MAVLEVLSKVIGSVELLGLVAFTKFVNAVQVLSTDVPLRRIWELLAAIATNISARCGGSMKSSFDS